MLHRTIRRALALFALALASVTIALAQSPTSIADVPAYDTWQVAQQLGSSKGELFVVTLDQPQRRQTCRVQSFTPDKLVCSRTLGELRTYLPQQVAALIVPGDGNLKLRLVLGFNGALGAAIWGTVVLAAACPVCAVATGIAALFFFGAAGAVLIGDEQSDRLIYLAPGQHLIGKLRSVQSSK
ncbi:MAG: hypothetical protein ABSG51_10440 [Terracidiphilus sp.]|jgi:hypothetical protein